MQLISSLQRLILLFTIAGSFSYAELASANDNLEILTPSDIILTDKPSTEKNSEPQFDEIKTTESSSTETKVTEHLPATSKPVDAQKSPPKNEDATQIVGSTKTTKTHTAQEKILLNKSSASKVAETKNNTNTKSSSTPPISKAIYKGIMKDAKGIKFYFHSDKPQDVNSIEIRIWDADSIEVSYTLKIEPVTEKKEQFLISVIPNKKSNLQNIHFEIHAPLTGGDYRSDYVLDLEKGELLNVTTVANQSAFDWGASQGLNVTIQKSNEIIFQSNFATISKGNIVTKSVLMNAVVNTDPVFIDLKDLVNDNRKFELPRRIQIENGSDERGTPIKLIASPSNPIEFLIHGSTRFPVNNRFDRVKLERNLQLDWKMKCPDCCDSPLDILERQTEFVIGIDPLISIAAATRQPSAPWLLLAITEKELVYLEAEKWTIKTGKLFDDHKLAFVDSRPNMFVMPFDLNQPQTKDFVVFSASTKIKKELIPLNTGSFGEIHQWISLMTALSNNLSEIERARFAQYGKSFFCLSSDAIKQIVHAGGIENHLEQQTKRAAAIQKPAEEFQKQYNSLRKKIGTVAELDIQFHQLQSSAATSDRTVEIRRNRMQLDMIEREIKDVRSKLDVLHQRILRTFVSDSRSNGNQHVKPQQKASVFESVQAIPFATPTDNSSDVQRAEELPSPANE